MGVHNMMGGFGSSIHSQRKGEENANGVAYGEQLQPAPKLLCSPCCFDVFYGLIRLRRRALAPPAEQPRQAEGHVT